MIRAAALLSFAFGLAAQGPQRDAQALTAALASDDARTVAFAAHEARAFGDKALTAALHRALRVWTKDLDDERSVVCLHVLDALLVKQAKLPPAELLPLLENARCGTAAFVLLAREPRLNEAELFELLRAAVPFADLDDQRFLRVWSIGNLLATQRSPRFAAFVWRQIDHDLHVSVHSSPAHSGRRRFGLARAGFGPLELVRGMPAEPVFELRPANQSGPASELLASGDPGIVVLRRIRHPEDGARFWDYQYDPMQWLRAMAGNPPQPWRNLPLEFDTAANYREQVVKAQAALLAFEQKLLRTLVANRAMTAEEARELAPTVAVVVEDHRTDTTTALPEIPPAK